MKWPFVITGCLLGWLLWGLSPAGAAVEFNILLATAEPRNSLAQRTGDEFVRLASQRLPQGWELLYYHSGQVGRGRALLQKLRLGSAGLLIASELEPVEAQILQMPFLFKDRPHLIEAQTRVLMPLLEAAAQKRGFILLGMWERGFRQISNNLRPLRKPEDLRGLRLRLGEEGSWRTRMFLEWGVQLTPFAARDLFQYLRQGQADGQESLLDFMFSGRLLEAQKYLSLSNHIYNPAYVLAWEPHWRKLPAQVRGILKEAAGEAQIWSWSQGEISERKNLAELRQAGILINQVDQAAFRAASRPLYDEFAQLLPQGRGLMDKIRALEN